MSEKDEIKKIVEDVFDKPLTENFKKTEKLVKGKRKPLGKLGIHKRSALFSLSHFDLDKYYNEADKEIMKKFPKYEKAIKSMEKADINPLPVYNKVHDMVTYNVMKLIKKKRDKYNLKQIEIDDNNVLTYVIEGKSSNGK